MIPKIIHYVWVGTNQKSDLVLKCIASWKKYCPNYTIREWNNEDVVKIKNAYLQEAFECRKWAFVADYLRLYALATQGGFYCDSDLEITSPIDKFRKWSFVTGYENWRGIYHPITAFMGAEKNNGIIKNLLAEYDNLHFLIDGKMDQTTNTKRISYYFEKKFKLSPPYDGEKTSYLEKNSVVYPWFYFCTAKKNEFNYSVHHFNGSWLDPVKPYSRKLIFKFGRFKLVKFKKKIRETTEKFSLTRKERILFSIKISKKKTICLIKKDKK